MIVLDDSFMKRFAVLAGQLSPENLAQDGEAPPEWVEKEYNRLMSEWRRLEKLVGRKVTEDEVYGWMDSRSG